MSYLQSEDALSNLVQAFENGTFPGKDWKHPEHLALAACYLYDNPFDAALLRARDRIRAYNESQGGKNTEDSGYHETLTVFWLQLVDRHLDRTKPRLAATRDLMEQFASQRDLYRKHYWFDLLTSREARANWVPPDLPVKQLEVVQASPGQSPDLRPSSPAAASA